MVLCSLDRTITIKQIERMVLKSFSVGVERSAAAKHFVEIFLSLIVDLASCWNSHTQSRRPRNSGLLSSFCRQILLLAVGIYP